MPRIVVSDDVLAMIRARRQGGDETADAVLRRVLSDAGPGTARPAAGRQAGFVDASYGIHFAEGFEIARTYKGRPFKARVEGGRWRLDADGRAYDSLNQLSQAVIDGNENAWMFWFFADAGGVRRRIAELRDPAQIQRRPRRRPQRRPVPEPGPGPAVPILESVPESDPEFVHEQAPVAPAPPTGRPAPLPISPSAPAAPASPGGGMAWEPRRED